MDLLLLPGKMSPVLAGRGRNSGIWKLRNYLYKNPRLLAFLHLPRNVRHGLKGKQEICQEIKFLCQYGCFLRVRYRSNFVNADLTLCFISQSLRSRVVVQLQYIAWPDHGKLSRWCTRRCVTPLGACVVSIPGTWCLLHWVILGKRKSFVWLLFRKRFICL